MFGISASGDTYIKQTILVPATDTIPRVVTYRHMGLSLTEKQDGQTQRMRVLSDRDREYTGLSLLKHWPCLGPKAKLPMIIQRHLPCPAKLIF
jgi:hypothetical protein